MNATTEKKASHTPGPWKIGASQYIYTSYDSKGKGVGDQQGYYTDIRVGKSHVEVWGHNTSKSETEANAKLIAAAPDMLEVIQQADAWLSFNQKPDADQIRVFRKSLQEVIKKATE